MSVTVRTVAGTAGTGTVARVTQLTMTKGLPASGKSTWACAQILASEPGRCVRINKDLLRDMLHAGRWQPGTEKQVLAARDALVERYLADGIDVIVDDTNLDPFHERTLRRLAVRHDARFVVADFTGVSADECVRRDLLRDRPVGETVIRRMQDTYLRGVTAASSEPRQIEDDEVVLVDIDGTLALMNGRSPYDWARVGEDSPNTAVVNLVRLLHRAGIRVMFLSGRDSICRAQTEAWLVEHVGVPGELVMRPAGDSRKDATVKRELFDAHVAGRYRVLFVLDDRDQVVAMWRDELGLTCLQVAPGNF